MCLRMKTHNISNYKFFRISGGKGSCTVVHWTATAAGLIKYWHLSGCFKPCISSWLVAAGGRSGYKCLSRNTEHFLGCLRVAHSFGSVYYLMESLCTWDAWDKLIPRPMCQCSCKAENFLSWEGMVKKKTPKPLQWITLLPGRERNAWNDLAELCIAQGCMPRDNGR